MMSSLICKRRRRIEEWVQATSFQKNQVGIEEINGTNTSEEIKSGQFSLYSPLL